MREGPPPEPKPKHEPTEAVLADFRKNCELEAGHVYLPEERDAIAHTLHDKLERLDAVEMLHTYEQGAVPTIESINRAADIAIKALREDANDTEALKHAKLIEGQTTQIRRWCRRYVETIVRFHTTRSAYMRMNEDEQRDMFVRADGERRRVHDSLLSSLSTMHELLVQGQDLTEYQPSLMWKPGANMPAGTAHEHPVMFAPEAIRDRDLIRDWAIIADGVEQLHALVRKMEQSETTVPNEEDGRNSGA